MWVRGTADRSPARFRLVAWSAHGSCNRSVGWPVPISRRWRLPGHYWRPGIRDAVRKTLPHLPSLPVTWLDVTRSNIHPSRIRQPLSTSWTRCIRLHSRTRATSFGSEPTRPPRTSTPWTGAALNSRGRARGPGRGRKGPAGTDGLPGAPRSHKHFDPSVRQSRRNAPVSSGQASQHHQLLSQATRYPPGGWPVILVPDRMLSLGVLLTARSAAQHPGNTVMPACGRRAMVTRPAAGYLSGGFSLSLPLSLVLRSSP